MKKNYETPCAECLSLVSGKIVCASPGQDNNMTVNDYTNEFGDEVDWDN